MRLISLTFMKDARRDATPKCHGVEDDSRSGTEALRVGRRGHYESNIPAIVPIASGINRISDQYRTKARTTPRLRQRLPPLPPKAGGNRRAQPIGSTPRPLSPLHQGSSASQPKAQEKQRALPKPRTGRMPYIDKTLTKLAERQPVPQSRGRAGECPLHAGTSSLRSPAKEHHKEKG
ncbi:hypothetical protein HPB51_017921 [Rhipicephalus microplus]|uniref:Uncharacterized protein n=1 Tax=Rhipicephalus microplus TaxID=6941 RepID=A0A9J6EP03_RHIMP|nr:hypothetical protein HPB51_017921 [Rhipicephalus microplus]